MRRVLRLVVLVFGVVVALPFALGAIFWLAGVRPPPETPAVAGTGHPGTAAAQAAPAAEKAVEALADLGTIKPALDALHPAAGWRRIEVRKAQPQDYALTLWYARGVFVAAGRPRGDTELIMRTVLGALVRAGRHPADERVNVRVAAMQHAAGETGTERVIWFGNTDYDYNRDAIGYESCDGKSWLLPC